MQITTSGDSENLIFYKRIHFSIGALQKNVCCFQSENMRWIVNATDLIKAWTHLICWHCVPPSVFYLVTLGHLTCFAPQCWETTLETQRISSIGNSNWMQCIQYEEHIFVNHFPPTEGILGNDKAQRQPNIATILYLICILALYTSPHTLQADQEPLFFNCDN